MHPGGEGSDLRQRHFELQGNVQRLLDDTAEFGTTVAHATPGEPHAFEGESLGDIDRALSSFFAHNFELKQRLRAESFSVAVLALAKSGKSTFINALTGSPLLPVNNIPETARICRITHTPLLDGEEPVLYDSSRGTPAETVIGEAAIRRHLGNLNREVRTREHQLSDEVLLDIQLPIRALAGHAGEGHNDVAFQLLDTPGPNESGEEALRFQVERLLDGVDAIIYLLDYTKLRTAEEQSIFSRLKQINPQLIKRLSRRLFFVVNKMDTIRVSEGLDEDSTREYVANLVTTQLADEGFQLRPEQVLLVSAQEALLSRLMLRRQPVPAPDVVRRFKERAFGSSRAVQRRTFSQADLNAAALDMCEDSGMQEVEQRVFGFLYSHAGALKLMAIVDDVGRMLNQMANSAAVSEGALMKDMAQLRGEAEALQKTLEETLSRFDEVQAQTAMLEAEVVDEVRTRLGFLRERLVEHVVAVLDGAAAADDCAPPTGRWRAVFDKARAFLGRRAAGADRAELQRTLQELHADIFREIDQEVRGFWHQLETATNERQRALLRRLNGHLEGLSRAIEAVVAERLSVRLEPVDLRLQPPTAQQFHDSLQRLFAAGITQKEVVKERSREVEFTQWERRYRNGLCRTGEYYVGRPSTRTVQEQYTVTEFEIQTDKIKEYFCELISNTIEASVRSVRAFVKQYLAATIETARTSITTYAERFTSCMLTALATSEQGEKARLAALEHVRGHKAGLEKLLTQTSELQAQAEALFPAAAASMSRAVSLEFDEDDVFSLSAEEEAAAGEDDEQPLPDAPAHAIPDAWAADASMPPADGGAAARQLEEIVSMTEAAAQAAQLSAGHENGAAAAAAVAAAAGATAAFVGVDGAICLLCGQAGHWTCDCPNAYADADAGEAAAAASSAHASAGGSGGADSLAGGSLDGRAAAGDAAADNVATDAVAGSSPRSARSDEAADEDALYDAASSVGGSFYYEPTMASACATAEDAAAAAVQAAAPLAATSAAMAEATEPAAAADAPLAVEVQSFSESDDEGTVDVEFAAAAPAAAAPAAPAGPGLDGDAFSGVSLDGSALSTAGAGPSSATSTHQLAVSAPVPAHSAADFQVQDSRGAGSGSIGGTASSSVDATNGELATIQLAGGSAPASPSAVSEASSGGDDWTVVDNEDSQEDQ
jgi:tRNA U34 5-carboxymethylaminomethyl modifying GTPase MnmE/TrmE